MISWGSKPDLETVEGTPQDRPKTGRHQKLWAILLVLDSFFVIIFGGALAAKVYQHWNAPAQLPPTARRHQTPKPKPNPPEPAPAAPKAEEPAHPAPSASKSQASAAKLAAKETAPPKGLPPPKPSLLHETAKQRVAPNPQDPSGASSSPAAAEPGVKPKAVPVEFRLKAPGAKSVSLVGAFIVRGGRKPMARESGDIWTITLYLTPNTYRYHFVVNGKKILDPENSATERGASVITVAAPAQ